MEKNNDGMHKEPNRGPTGLPDTGQRTKMHDQRNCGALRQEEADQYPSRPEMEREQQERLRLAWSTKSLVDGVC